MHGSKTGGVAMESTGYDYVGGEIMAACMSRWFAETLGTGAKATSLVVQTA